MVIWWAYPWQSSPGTASLGSRIRGPQLAAMVPKGGLGGGLLKQSLCKTSPPRVGAGWASCVLLPGIWTQEHEEGQPFGEGCMCLCQGHTCSFPWVGWGSDVKVKLGPLDLGVWSLQCCFGPLTSLRKAPFPSVCRGGGEFFTDAFND